MKCVWERLVHFQPNVLRSSAWCCRLRQRWPGSAAAHPLCLSKSLAGPRSSSSSSQPFHLSKWTSRLTVVQAGGRSPEGEPWVWTFSKEGPLVLRVLHRSAVKQRSLTWCSPLLSRTLSLSNYYSWGRQSCVLMGAEETVKNDCPVLVCHCLKGPGHPKNPKNVLILRTLSGSHRRLVFFFFIVHLKGQATQTKQVYLMFLKHYSDHHPYFLSISGSSKM